MRILTRDGNPQVRMAFLATVGGSHVNGVAELHSQLLRDVTLKDFSEVFPDRFTNVTNGVTPRRFVRLANPRLSALITEGLGTDSWMADLEQLQGLAPLADDASFLERFAEVKQANKRDFADFAAARYGFSIDPNTMFDSMVKRLHEYKRQSLKILAVIAQYAAIKDGSAENLLPRTVFFGAKAAPGYAMAKLTIRLINNVARVIDQDPDVAGRLQVRFPENYNIELAEHLIPATELDEQISQAGKEASGTGNMKFALNGALTVGTLDGANVEIRERVGAENFFLFGLEVEDVDRLYAGNYNPMSYVQADPRLKKAIDLVANGTFSEGDRDVYAPLVSDWLTKDYFMAMADFTAYMDIQQEIEDTYRDQKAWNRSAILNVANSGYFSSDRSIQDYLDRIWHTAPLPENN
jgi:starch phosphorylase